MQIEDEDVPYIEPPDVMNNDPNGLFCFFNADRPCGPECMAYTPGVSESKYLSDQQKDCVILVSAERLGRYAGGIMSIIKDSTQFEKNAKADKARADALKVKETKNEG